MKDVKFSIIKFVIFLAIVVNFSFASAIGHAEEIPMNDEEAVKAEPEAQKDMITEEVTPQAIPQTKPSFGPGQNPYPLDPNSAEAWMRRKREAEMDEIERRQAKNGFKSITPEQGYGQKWLDWMTGKRVNHPFGTPAPHTLDDGKTRDHNSSKKNFISVQLENPILVFIPEGNDPKLFTLPLLPTNIDNNLEEITVVHLDPEELTETYRPVELPFPNKIEFPIEPPIVVDNLFVANPSLSKQAVEILSFTALAAVAVRIITAVSNVVVDTAGCFLLLPRNLEKYFPELNSNQTCSIDNKEKDVQHCSVGNKDYIVHKNSDGTILFELAGKSYSLDCSKSSSGQIGCLLNPV
jgi:hypothetical protein